MVVQRLNLPCHTTKLNQLLKVHWAKANRLKRIDQQVVSVCAANDGTTRATGPRKVSLFIFAPKGSRKGDPDAYWKSLLDALVTAGLLVDDSPKWCTLGSVNYARGNNQSMLVTLEDLPEDITPEGSGE